MGKLAVTWKRSTIGFRKDQGRTIEALGLHRLHQTVEHDDTPSIRGMIKKIEHLLEVKEVK
jgi:large subunit ribosomal protein L30